MSAELSAKVQLALWWITSIAISVLCCSILFLFFAGYLVDIKRAVQDSHVRMTVIEEREGRILAEIEMIRKRVVSQGIAGAPASAAPQAVPVSTAAPAAPTPAPVEGAVAPASVAPATVPTTVAPIAAPAVPAIVPPQVPGIVAPAAPVPAEKK